MTVRNAVRHFEGCRVAARLAVFALMILAPPVVAQAEQGARFHIWIQDPWTGDTVLTQVGEPDTSLWNGARIDDYEESIQIAGAPPLGILTIESLGLEVPIYNGTDEYNLNRGVGRIRGMGKMQGDDNLGLSGHRDGYFRVLKDLKVGDEIQVENAGGKEKFTVTDLDIVPKTDDSVLTPTQERTLTIVTCYPFYFVGNALKRLIVTVKPVL